MRETRNITVSVSKQTYSSARVWAARHNTSVSGIVEFLLDHLPAVVQTIHELQKKYYDFESRGHTAE